LIVQCPSCKSRFSVDASKITNPSMKGRCSVCGHVFVLLDNAADEMEAATIRDSLEEARAKRVKDLGGISGIYEIPESVDDGKLTEENDRIVSDVGDLSEVEVVKESKEFDRVDETIEIGDEEGKLSEPNPEDDALVEESSAVIEPELPDQHETSGLEEKVSVETPEETVGSEPSLDEKEGEEEPIPEEILLSQKEAAGTQSDKDIDLETNHEENKRFDELDETDSEQTVMMDESFNSLKEPKKHRSFLPLLIGILIVVVVGGGVWYVYRSGQLGAPQVFLQSLIEKVKNVRGASSLILFDLKNEQEPATDGRFFVVRGFVQNKGKKSFPYLVLRINVYDAKNKIILSKQTIAGRVLKPDEISKMTIQEALKQFSVMNEMNRKSSGKLDPGKKLPFVFLFDLSKFPRDRAKTFQVEILKAGK